MNEVYLLLGSNEGKPEGNLLRARALIAEKCGAIGLQSSIYETEAWGVKEQAPFLNQALSIKTDFNPSNLLLSLKSIEKQLGRVETSKWGPRVIDIDILFYGQEKVNLPDLKIPHPYIQERRFTLVPMAEIAPQLRHPVLGKTMTELLRECADNSEVRLKA
jgi:2-amino-4-hydroxy-6-hydroxymethyldihydropteridine diphosphokinase